MALSPNTKDEIRLWAATAYFVVIGLPILALFAYGVLTLLIAP
jgi:hypothetical protein